MVKRLASAAVPAARISNSRAASPIRSAWTPGRMPPASQWTTARLSWSSRNLARSAWSMRRAIGPGSPDRVSTARASSSAPGYGSAPPRIHFAAEYRPSRSTWAQIVSIGPVWRTSSGVTISGQAPCSALVARWKRGSRA
jgi:hypothetical protein